MVKINDIHSTATFAWSNDSLPTLATGTAAGVIDDDFSSKSILSFYDLDNKTPKLQVDADAKFHDLDWSKSNNLLAGALENGNIQFWNTENLQSQNNVTSIAKGEKHSGQIKSLQFNPIQNNILASGGANSEIFIWDTNKITNLSPFIPGTAMTPMDTVQSVSWNNSVSHIFASAGSAGYTSIWDLKAKKEVLHLSYTENSGSKANLSVVSWHPTQSTKLITASESDGAPLLLTWDLRNSNAPERILSGHKKGILSVDWNKKDPNFLLSSGKDNTTILWNPITGDKLAQYPTTANWVFKTRFAPESPDIFASASFDKKIVVQTLQDTSPPVSKRINSTNENDFWNQISDTDTQQPEYFIKQAPNWYGSPSAVSFGFGGKVVSLSKTGEKSSEVKITKFKPDGFKDNDSLKTALESGDFKSLIDENLSKSFDDINKSDWELLNELDGQSNVFDKFISLNISDDETTTESRTNGDATKDASNDEDFFQNLGESKPSNEYLPSGEFNLIDQDSNLKKLSDALLSKNLSKAIDISLSNDQLIEALIIALNGSDDLKNKVKNAYFNKYASQTPIARLLYSVSSNNINDLVENGNVSNWKEIANSIKNYSQGNDEVLKKQFIKLGDRIYKSDPIKNRNDAIKTYISASALDKVAEIWVSELKTLESKILSNSKKSPYDAHFQVLNEFVEKFSAYRSNLKLDAPVTNNESLLSTILEYTSIISSSGQFELANKFLNLLSNDIPAVKLEKERIAKASGIGSRATTTTTNTRTSRLAPNNPYVAQQPNIPNAATSAYGLPVPNVPAPVNQSPYAPFAQPNLSTPSSNPYRPAVGAPGPVALGSAATTAAASIASNPYKPAVPTPSASGFNPYRPNDLSANVAPGNPSSAIPPPPKAPTKKNETEGWNDLPSTFQTQTRRSTPAAPAAVAAPVQLPQPNVSTPQPPSLSRNQSFVNAPSIPPPPRSVSKSRKSSAQVETPAPTQPNTRYTPTQQPANVFSPNLSNNQSGAPPPPPAAAAPSNPYAPSANTAPAPSNPYAPPPPASGPPAANPYAVPPPPIGAGIQAPSAPSPYAPPPQIAGPPQVPKPNPYAPSANATPQVSSPFPVAPPSVGPPLTAAAQLQQQQQQFQGPPQVSSQAPPIAPPKSEPPKSKYPSGDRSHIPEGSLNIYKKLDEQFNLIKPNVPEKYGKQVIDTEKRLNILFDHLNNEDLLTSPTINKLNSLVDSLSSKDYQTALNTHVDLLTNHSNEGGNWLVGIKRLIQFAEALN
ncbi:hypothetical protein BN7_4158 [Wickerhamomyces ciferrii]|uniref:Protein transport protein SEC31 n=1 Tax=Wickerhamomyces ciferrii (strain ATCC 14091 / BCRC 22168 / CBS 111 / JCM 3599 / NBRC 0793 / NRRL Y-1031 F-60-10) TaxID=1206466 RepID=K0KNM0_WICCF|nr:uncharacterized protein BN7_4158 [Wickerhamomyces ciferrii]CCH44591.1 hypothetical protein BN7_4158 [Wickerhamomyces ciferrii]